MRDSYVIMRDDGLFVAPPGREHSYTDKLHEAVWFTRRDDAERNRCPGNERVVSVLDVMGSNGGEA